MESKDNEAKAAPYLSRGAKDETDLFSEKSYSQLYIVMRAAPIDPEAKRNEGNAVLFSCGNWTYTGLVHFDDMTMSVSEIPRIIPTLQKQQSNLRYFCHSSEIPNTCEFSAPAKFAMSATQFFAQQMCDPFVENELVKLAKVCPWVEDDADANTYFELETMPQAAPPCMAGVAIVASKMYVRGLIVITIYSNGTFYFVVQSGEGEQALLDVRFPDVTQKGQGMHLASYTLNDRPWQKLTLWHLLGKAEVLATTKLADLPRPKTLTMSSKNYQQTYCVLRSAWEGVSPTISMHHDSLFRFGSWCYAGRVQLTPTIALQDIPFVIPALRLQQSRMEFLCPVDSVPITSPFAAALDYLQSREALLESLIEQSAEALQALIERLSMMGLGDAVSQWLDGDASSSFYEFKIEPDEATQEAFKAVELVCSKSYHASGIITKQIFYNFTLYVCIEDGSNENPLLDSTFPDVSGKGRGYQIYNYNEPTKDPLANTGPSNKDGSAATAPGGGHPLWPELKKVSIWQTVGALEQEFRDRASKQNAAKTASDSAAGTERYPQFTFKSQTNTDADNRATAQDIVGDASVAEGEGSMQGLSLLAHPNDGHDNASLSQDSNSQLLPSGKAYFPVLDDDKDWTQNTVVSSIADIGTGNIKGSVNVLVSKESGEFLPDEEASLTTSNAERGITSPASAAECGGSVAGGDSAAGSAGGSGSGSGSGSQSVGGSWRSMGSVHGGTRGGIGGRGVVSRSVVSQGGRTGLDSQGREIIGSNYQYGDGFDVSEHTRIREREFVQDTHERNRADLKALQSENNTSLSGRINSFVSSYNSATVGLAKAGSPKKEDVPVVAEAKSNSGSGGGTEKSDGNWDRLGGIVEDYEVKLAISRSQMIRTLSESEAAEMTAEGAGAADAKGGGGGGGVHGNEATSRHLDEENASVSTLGGDSVVNIASQKQQLLAEAEPVLAQRAVPVGGPRPAFPKFGGGLPAEHLAFGSGSEKNSKPHHLPQMNDALSSRLDTIRATMALQVERHPPWDPAGNPLTKIAAQPSKSKATKK